MIGWIIAIVKGPALNLAVSIELPIKANVHSVLYTMNVHVSIYVISKVKCFNQITYPSQNNFSIIEKHFPL